MSEGQGDSDRMVTLVQGPTNSYRVRLGPISRIPLRQGPQNRLQMLDLLRRSAPSSLPRPVSEGTHASRIANGQGIL
jgi:hypothetical protein